MRTIHDIIELTRTNGGGTFNSKTFEDVTHGTAVAIVNGTFRRVLIDDTEGIANAIRDIIDTFGTDANIGTWSNDGYVHVDPSVVFEKTEDAIAFGREHAQLAVFIIDTFTEVTIEP